MSFHFNLSSSSEEDDEEEVEWRRERDQFRRAILGGDDGDDDGEQAEAEAEEESERDRRGAAIKGAGEASQSGDDDDDEESGGSDEVDWEDGHDGGIGGGGDDDDDDSGDGDAGENASAGRRLPTEGVTIDFSPTSPSKSDDNKGKRRPRTIKKLKGVPPVVARLVTDLHRSHLLALTARCVHLSGLLVTVTESESSSPCCHEQELLLGLALSIVPPRFHPPSSATTSEEGEKCDDDPTPTPTLELVREFSHWFFDLVNDVEGRRARIAEAHAAAGAPPPAAAGRSRRGEGRRSHRTRGGAGSSSLPADASPSPAAAEVVTGTEGGTDDPTIDRLAGLLRFLSPSLDDDHDPHRDHDGNAGPDPPRTIAPLEKALLFLAAARSMRWRARYVSALDPASRDLTCDHPLLRDDGKGVDVKNVDVDVDVNVDVDGGGGGGGAAAMVVARVLRASVELGLLPRSDHGGLPALKNGNGKKRRRLDDGTPPSPMGGGGEDVAAIDLTGAPSSSDGDGDGDGDGGRSSPYKVARSRVGLRGDGTGGSAATPVMPPRELRDDEHIPLSWVEILCHRRDGGAVDVRPSNNAGASPKSPTSTPSSIAPEWVHVDVHNGLFDRPRLVEGILSTVVVGRRGESESDRGRGRNGGGKIRHHQTASPPPPHRHGRRRGRYNRRRRAPGRRREESTEGKMGRSVTTRVSYVLGVEHRSHHPGGGGGGGEADTEAPGGAENHEHVRTAAVPRLRLTDVTPRYANYWSKTLRLRGATGGQMARGGGRCVDEWWRETVGRINKRGRKRKRKNKWTAGQRSSNTVVCPAAAAAKTTFTGSGVNDAIVLDSSDDDDDEDEEKKCGGGPNEEHTTTLNHSRSSSEDDDEDESAQREIAQFRNSVEREAIPTSKAAFKNHPIYVIPSVLNMNEVLRPDASGRVCGMFKGELVYRRSDVSVALPAKKWPYESRRVREVELARPVKTVKARKKPASSRFKALKSYGVGQACEGDGSKIGSTLTMDESCEDGMQRLYGRWQTDKWRPKTVAPDEDIPVNEYKNVEKALINPGLVHMEEYRISVVAKKLGIPYAPCLLGFEGHGGNRTPNIRGIVVHEHNAELLREAHAEWESQALEQEHAKHQREVCMRWKKLVVGVLTKARLERDYGDQK